ncbi:hypothetical protein [Effusibacillus lacus]|uniref:hypothetical protein n=1 Tax=Effusibacillus lacus TaxID=1348429 RepID=UPI000BB83CC1|nr:hypothetical protein [Effusibacillus lacus]TCS72825.1 hypothetical protein EDD64_12040 [Effusibacillus lacus]
MCVLCGESVMKIHWTDRKQGHDGSNPIAVAGGQQRARQRDRLHRIRLTNRILRYYSLSVEDWSGSKFILRDKKGRSAVIQDLGELWPAAEKMAGRPLNPLDPSFLSYLASNKT